MSEMDIKQVNNKLFSILETDAMQSLYDTVFEVHTKGQCYKQSVLKRDTFTKEI